MTCNDKVACVAKVTPGDFYHAAIYIKSQFENGTQKLAGKNFKTKGGALRWARNSIMPQTDGFSQIEVTSHS